MNESSNLWSKLERSKKYREGFVAAQLKRGIPRQMRVLLKQRGWPQSELAERSGLTQGAISRAADPDYGNLTFNNVLKIAAGFDIAFVGKFVPFSELSRWYDSITDEEALTVDSFDEDAERKADDLSRLATLAGYSATPMEIGPDSDIYHSWVTAYLDTQPAAYHNVAPAKTPGDIEKVVPINSSPYFDQVQRKGMQTAAFPFSQLNTVTTLIDSEAV